MKLKNFQQRSKPTDTYLYPNYLFYAKHKLMACEHLVNHL